jgi:hypothetical protein
MIALDSVNAARSSAVLISGLPATLPRTPSKMLGTSRPYAEGCDCTFVEAAIALITIIPTTNTIPARRPVVIDQLPFVRSKRSAKFPSLVSPHVSSWRRVSHEHSMTRMLKPFV